MKIKFKEKIEEKAFGVAQNMAMQAQMNYVKWVAKEEKVDFEIAWEISTGTREYKDGAKYTLGFKLADPAWMIAIFKQPRKTKRQQAAENFAKGLNETEAKIFWSEVFNQENGKAFKEKYKEAKKNKGLPEDDDPEE
jgi:hypothetical protein